LQFEASRGWQGARPYLNRKGTGKVAQVVEHLAGKHEALNSNPHTAKKKKFGFK
jgi:hypothetical protein